jgi:ribosome-associated protein
MEMPLDPPAAPAPGGLVVRPDLVIPERELEVRRTRSSGPGGQNVNKVSTRVEVAFDVRGSSVLTEEQKQRLLLRLRSRTSRRGILRVAAQRHRTQSRNEAEARRRLAALVAAALEEARPRRATRPTRTSRLRRLDEKRQRGEIKRSRRGPDGAE